MSFYIILTMHKRYSTHVHVFPSHVANLQLCTCTVYIEVYCISFILRMMILMQWESLTMWTIPMTYFN